MTDSIEALARKYKTPRDVQRFLATLPYNRELTRETLRSARETLRAGTGHCFECVFVAAAILERHGYEPLILSLESKDYLDHIVFLFREKGNWGTIGRSREEGLQGRPPRYRSLKALALSYYEPFIDKTGKLTAYQIFHLDEMKEDWRTSAQNLWGMERYLGEQKHIALPTPPERYSKTFRRYLKRGPPPRRSFWW